jgi:hypothetical protein
LLTSVSLEYERIEMKTLCRIKLAQDCILARQELLITRNERLGRQMMLTSQNKQESKRKWDLACMALKWTF